MASPQLLRLKQHNRSVSDHLIDFRILAVEAGWPDVALRGIFYQSLNDSINDHLCSQPETHSFEELVSAALRSDVRLREQQRERIRQDRKVPQDSSTHTTIPDLPQPPLIANSSVKTLMNPCKLVIPT